MRLGREHSRFAFEAHILGIESVISSPDMVLDDHFRGVRTHGIFWSLLKITKPLLLPFGIDPFIHVRVDRVAKNLKRYLAKNRCYIDSYMKNRISDRVITPWNKKTGGAYSSLLHAALPSSIKKPKPPPAPKPFFHWNWGIPSFSKKKPHTAPPAQKTAASAQTELQRIFGCSITDAASLRSAFTKWALKNHPDKVSAEKNKSATIQFQKVTSLMKELKDAKGWV